MGGVSKLKQQQFVPTSCLLFIVVTIIAAALQSTTAAAAGGEPSSPVVAGSSSSPEAKDFIQSLCNATGNEFEDVSKCCDLLAPYAVSINGSKARAIRASVTVLAAGLQDLAKSVVEYNRTECQDQRLGPCIQVIHEATSGSKQQLAELDAAAAGGDANPAALAKVKKWFQEVKVKIENCDSDIADVPGSSEVLYALPALDSVVSASAGAPK